MKAPYVALALAGLAVAASAAAQNGDDLLSKTINDYASPNVVGAKGKLIDDPKAQAGKALRVVVAKKGADPWDSAVESTVTKPIKAGDNLILAFNARLQQADGGATTATLPYNAVQMSAAPYTPIFSGPLTIGPEWKLYQVKGKAAANYAANTVKATIQLGNAKQTVDFGTIFVFDMGQ